MKKLFSLLILLTSFINLHAQQVDIEMADGRVISYYTDEIKNIKFYEVEPHEYVDLGLTSGNLWATTNLGASSPSEYGSYFAWGEIEPKIEYTEENYKFGCYNGEEYQYLKYVCHESANKRGYEGFYDDKSTLDLGDDAAYIAYRGRWRIPTLDDFNELIRECTWQYTENGYKVISKNGQSIFLPFAQFQGYGPGLGHSGYGYYMSSQNIESDAKEIKYLSICSYYKSTSYTLWRHLGISIRPVLKNQE